MAPRRALVAASLIVVVAAGCSDSEGASDTMPPIATDVSAATSPTATMASQTSGAPSTTSPPTTAAPTTTAVPSTTAAPTTTAAPPTTAPPTTAAPTTTAAPAGGAIQLGANGLGSSSFGDDAETVIGATTDLIGPSTRDDGWVDPLSYGACPGDRYRQVVWSDLTLEFSEENGQQRFIGYVYGSVSGVNPEPPGLVSSEGIGVGSTVAELQAAYPNASTTPGEAGLQDPRYAVPGEFEGYLTGVEDGDIVISVEAGRHCGG